MYKLTKNQFNFLVSLIANRAEVRVTSEMRIKVYDLFFRIGYDRIYTEQDRDILNTIRAEFLNLKLKQNEMDDLPF